MRILSPAEAARAAGVAVQTLKLWTDTGRLPAMRTATGRRVIREEDLRAYLRARQQSKATPRR